MAPRKKSQKRTPQRLSGIQSARDRTEALETILRAFSNPSYMERHMECAVWRLADDEHTRIAVDGGRVVSAVAMAPRTIRFGHIHVPAMTVGPVGTHDRYRKLGYSSAAINDACDYMKNHGILLAYLLGIPDYYYRFGFYPYMARSSFKLNREAARKQSTPARPRAMRAADLPDVARLYEAANAGRTCSSVRDAGLWKWLFGPGRNTWLFRGPRVVPDARGRICAYFTNNSKDQLDIREVVVRSDEESCRLALGAIVAEARRREIKDISLPLPPDDPLALFIRQRVPAEITTWTNPTGGSLMKVVDFAALMRALEPLLAERWLRRARPAVESRAHESAPRGEFCFAFESDIGSIGIAIDGETLRVAPPPRSPRARIGQRWLSGLLTGYYGVRDVATREGSAVTATLVPVLEVLFPQGWPWVHQGDNY